MVLEVAAAGLAQALLNRWATDASLRLLAKRRNATALDGAVRAAAQATDGDPHCRAALGRYDVNSGFFEHEGADEIAKLLVSGPGPDARELARAAGADGADGGALAVAFEVFLEHLASEMSRHAPFRERLAQLERTGTARAADTDERELAGWLAERFRHVQTAGIGTARHLQVPLEEVYVPASGVLDRHADERWGTREERQRLLLAEQLCAGELSHEDYEAELDRLEVARIARSDRKPPAVAVLDTLRDTEQALVLGDPGAGKTTLLRYLTLRHAQALCAGRATAGDGLGRTRLTLYVRAGELARHPDRDRGLGAFLATYLLERLECPLDPAHLRSLIRLRLQAGRCLVLVDGLDEVTSAAERGRVVDATADFAIAWQPRGNRIVCTSRIAGYAAAPLPATFTALRLLDMDDAAVERFVRGYVPAIERREAPDKAPALARRDAEGTAAALLDAIASTPGVRRLAANPLLLTALLLVHRTTGGLPSRRVEAYKAVVDALGKTWRAKQGVPDAELPDERHLTEWLTLLAEWMHAERPEASVGLRDLLSILGPLWAEHNHRAWDAEVLASADPAASDVGAGVLEFVRRIDRHCGLLVERAPGRWGFAHLTFEEYYAGRALAFPRRARDRPVGIRERLHDPRYDEPILLALGLVGIDYAAEVDDLVRAALLAEGDEARDLGLTPTAHEDLLGRDFRFALRALADDIPVRARLVDALLHQALDEALDAQGRGRFEPYREALLERLASLKPIAIGRRLAELLAGRLDVLSPGDSGQVERLIEVAAVCVAHPDVTRRLELIATTGEPGAAIDAARVLAGHGPLGASAVKRLVTLVEDPDYPHTAIDAAEVLAGQGPLADSAVDRLVTLVEATADPYTAIRAAEVLVGQVPLADSAVERLFTFIETLDDPYAASAAAEVLAGQGPLADSAVARLFTLIENPDSPYAAVDAARVLAAHGPLADGAVDRLFTLIENPDSPYAAMKAAWVLARHGPLAGSPVERLVTLVKTSANHRTAIDAARVLAGQGALADSAVERLVTLVETSDNPGTAIDAGRVLAGHGPIADSAVTRLVTLVETTDNPYAAIRATEMLAGQGPLADSAVDRLVTLIEIPDDLGAAMWAAEVLAGLGPLADSVVERLARLARAGNKAAYDALWRA